MGKKQVFPCVEEAFDVMMIRRWSEDSLTCGLPLVALMCMSVWASNWSSRHSTHLSIGALLDQVFMTIWKITYSSVNVTYTSRKGLSLGQIVTLTVYVVVTSYLVNLIIIRYSVQYSQYLHDF